MSSPDADPLPLPADPGQAPAGGSAASPCDPNTRLAAIRAAVQLLAQELHQLDATATRPMVLAIHRGTCQLAQLTDDLHTLLARREGRLAETRAPFNGQERGVYEAVDEHAHVRRTGQPD